MKKVLSLLALSLALVASPSQARDWDFTANAGLTSNYLWRGFDVGRAGIFADASISRALTNELSVTGLLWSYTQLDGGVELGEADYDLSLTWAPSGRPFTLTGGWVYYDMAGAVDSQEVYVGVDFDYYASPFIRAYYDFDQNVGVYLLMGASKGYSLTDRLDLDVHGTLGLDFGRGIDTFNDFAVGASLGYSLDRNWSLFWNNDLVVPSHQVGLYGARVVSHAGVSYGTSF